jgi:hypothetical protein
MFAREGTGERATGSNRAKTGIRRQAPLNEKRRERRRARNPERREIPNGAKSPTAQNPQRRRIPKSETPAGGNVAAIKLR